METDPLTINSLALPIVPVDFTRTRRLSLKALGGGVYAYPRPCAKCGILVDPVDRKCRQCGVTAPDLVYWERPCVDGRQTTRKLKSTTLRHAQLEVGKHRSDQALAKIGRAADPYSRASVATVDELADFYVESGCPKRNEQQRNGKQLEEEKRRVDNLKRHLGPKMWTKITLEDLREFHRLRIAEVAHDRGQAGHRAVELEEHCLSAVLRWAARNHRRTGVTHNPIGHDRPRHQTSDQVRHCRDTMPANADELHALAAALFDEPKSEALGWLLVFEAMIGQRIGELLRLRVDAHNDKEPGHIGGRHLWLYRSQTHKGTFPYADIHAALRDCLDAHQAWHQARYPKSPWYFPSHVDKGAQPVDSGSLSHALRRICPLLGQPLRTSHGFRSYFVNVLRSQGKPDAEIALRIGHKSGGKLIVEVYGEILPYKLTWLPESGDPAWSIWIPGREPRPEQMELGI